MTGFNFATAFNNMFSGAPSAAGGQQPNQQQDNPQGQLPPGMGGNADPMNGNQGGGNLTNPNAGAGGNNPTPGGNGNPGSSTPTRNAGDVDYTKLFDNTPAVGPDGKPIVEDTGYLPKMDPTKVNEAFGRMKFTEGITPEQRAAMVQGGEAGVAAMMDVIDNVGRSISARTFNTNFSLMEKALPSAFEKFSGGLDSRINLNMANNMGRSNNPVMADPQFAPVVDQMRTLIGTKNPHLTADQINQATNKYFDEMAGKLGYKKEAAPAGGNSQNNNSGKKTTGGVNEANWDDWISNSLTQNT